MASLSLALSLSLSRLSSPLSSPSHIKRLGGVNLKCRAGSSPEMETDPTEKSLSISSNSLSAGLSSLGLIETGYLTYLKFTNSEAFCPVGGGNCSDVLNSDYSVVFGVPLSLVGMIAYGSVTLLSLQQAGIISIPNIDKIDGQLILTGVTTSLAASSAYFLYLLSTKFDGTTCSYCLVSAFLSFTLFFINLKNYGLNKIGLQLALAALVIAGLNNSYSSSIPQLTNAEEMTLERYETEITKESTPYAIALAKHLNSIGAKMYGAFWCSHCNEQKEMFGREAAKIINYVECFPNGAGKGRKMAFECAIVGLKGFPTWVIKDQVVEGEQDFSTLAKASGFVYQDNNDNKAS
ncbi:hypothetical protein LUZ60_014505 [Juncus effusus]|nr:hypothetical protein LUZ60_014505 [Juncus effusus]